MTAEIKEVKTPAFEEYLDPGVIWWPWWVAVEYYRRKTLHLIGKTNLMVIAQRGMFLTGKRAGAPCKLAPVDRASYMSWVNGGSKRKVR